MYRWSFGRCPESCDSGWHLIIDLVSGFSGKKKTRTAKQRMAPGNCVESVLAPIAPMKPNRGFQTREKSPGMPLQPLCTQYSHDIRYYYLKERTPNSTSVGITLLTAHFIGLSRLLIAFLQTGTKSSAITTCSYTAAMSCLRIGISKK